MRQPRQLRLCGGWSHYWCDARAKAGELQSAESFTRSLRCRQPGNRRLKAPPGLDGRTGAETALLTRGASLGPVEERQAPIALVNRSLFAATNDQRSFDSEVMTGRETPYRALLDEKTATFSTPSNQVVASPELAQASHKKRIVPPREPSTGANPELPIRMRKGGPR